MHPIAILANELSARHIMCEMDYSAGQYVLSIPSRQNCKFWVRQDPPKYGTYYRIFDYSGDLPAENGLLEAEEIIERYWELKEKEN